MTVCKIEGCTSPIWSRGWCSKHYQRFRKHGDPGTVLSRPKSTCSIPDCDRPVKGRGWCGKHYARWRQHGSTELAPPPAPKPCSVEGCSLPRHSRQFCSLHYQRFLAHGDPETLLRRPKGTGSIMINGYLMLTKHDHPLATTGKGQVLAHRVVLYDAIGPGWHRCHWCGTAIRWEDSFPRDWLSALVVDHLDGDKLNNDLANLVASCGSCNIMRQRIQQEEVGV